jgi:hypothetical protein
MAHFAELDENNIVTRVIVVHNNELMDGETESEVKGVSFCTSLLGGTNWIQTSYNNNMRKQFAGVGYTYDDINDVFVAPQPYPSWTLDENHDWQPPSPKPDDENSYTWNEETQSWDIVESE